MTASDRIMRHWIVWLENIHNSVTMLQLNVEGVKKKSWTKEVSYQKSQTTQTQPQEAKLFLVWFSSREFACLSYRNVECRPTRVMPLPVIGDCRAFPPWRSSMERLQGLDLSRPASRLFSTESPSNLFQTDRQTDFILWDAKIVKKRSSTKVLKSSGLDKEPCGTPVDATNPQTVGIEKF